MSALAVPKFNIEEAYPYPEILKMVQEYMKDNFTELSSNETMSADDELLFMKNIDTFLQKKSIVSAELPTTELIKKLYCDMKQYSFLTPYLTSEKIEELGLEEIRVNSWESVYLISSKEGKIRVKQKFLSPEHAQDIVKRLLKKSGMIIDKTQPYALGHIGKNQRIGSFLSPILDEEIGVCATLRIVTFSKLTKPNLIEWKTATAEMLEFIEMCLSHGVSICVAGATGSGKTGTLGYSLSSLVQDDKLRLLTIEEGSREFDFIKRDEIGDVINDVVHLLTHKSNDEKHNISQNTLLEQILRHTPDIIGIGEMRSDEAFTAIEASLTDHVVGTTTHAQSAVDTYERMVMLAVKGTTSFSEESLMRKAIKAFPIIVYQEEFPDNSRRISEIIEGIDYKNGEVICKTLYRFNHICTENDNGFPNVIGDFERVGGISDSLRKRLSKRGVSDMELLKFEGRSKQ